VRGTHSAADDSVRESPSHLQADAVGKPFHPQPRTGSFAESIFFCLSLRRRYNSSTRAGTVVSSRGTPGKSLAVSQAIYRVSHRWACCHVTAAGAHTTHILCGRSDVVYWSTSMRVSPFHLRIYQNTYVPVAIIMARQTAKALIASISWGVERAVKSYFCCDLSK
jgi:hypothetical protein